MFLKRQSGGSPQWFFWMTWTRSLGHQPHQISSTARRRCNSSTFPRVNLLSPVLKLSYVWMLIPPICVSRSDGCGGRGGGALQSSVLDHHQLEWAFPPPLPDRSSGIPHDPGLRSTSATGPGHIYNHVLVWGAQQWNANSWFVFLGFVCRLEEQKCYDVWSSEGTAYQRKPYRC